MSESRLDALPIERLLALFEAADIRLSAEGDRVRFSAPHGALTAELRAALQARRDDIVAALAAHSGPGVAIPTVPRSGALLLSSAQQRLWFLDRYDPNSSTYNIPAMFRLKGRIDLAALDQAIAGLMSRHEALRTVFSEAGGRPFQRVLPSLRVTVDVIDVRRDTDPHSSARAQVQLEALRPFDLAEGPLVRATLVTEADESHTLLLVLHHIVCDGWSLGIIAKELGVLYDAALAQTPPALEPLRIQYADYAAWQRGQVEETAQRTQLEYWKQVLGDQPPVLQLPSDRVRPPVQTFPGRNISALLPADLLRRVKAVGQQEGATLFMTLLAAFNSLLFRYTGQEDLAVGTPIANRRREDTEGLIGFFVNTLVLRTAVHGSDSFRQLLRRTRDTALGAFEHQDVPFEKLVEELHPARDVSRSPFFQVLFVLQNAPFSPLRLSGFAPSPLEYPGGTSKFDLTLFTEETSDGLLATVEFNTDLFDERTIRRMLGHYRQLLESIAADPDQCVASLTLLTPAERHQILFEWNASARAHDQRQTVHERFEAQAAATPDAVAVEAAGTATTYRQLNARANALARHLRSLGVTPEGRVGICLPRSLDMVTAVLAVLKAGGAYVALDATYPAERLRLMLDDAAVALVLVNPSTANALPTGNRVQVDLTAISDQILATDENPSAVTGPDNMVYVTYTSGSTGRPKGIAMIQSAVLNLLDWMLRTTALPGARTLQFASLGFDVSFQDMFSTWLSGGTLVLISDEERKDVRGLAPLVCERQIHRLFIPAVALQQLAEGFQDDPTLVSVLRKVIAGSEQLMVTDALTGMFRRLPDCSLHNEYGPSETHVVTELALPRSPDAWPARPPIGRPIDNTQIYLLDRGMQPLPAGVPGELFIGGAGLARGYLGLEQVTAERFIPNPFGTGRLYRTGDLARYLPDGTIEFLGRIDHQMKIRGYRVEPGEVEAALEEHTGVREAVVMPWTYGPADVRLVAYVAADRPMTSAATLRTFLADRLPDYMVPSVITVLDTLPLTPHGKIDRRALPAPDASRPELSVAFAEPQGDIERIIAEVWREALQVDRVGAHDNFFDLGGHSLLIVQVQSRLRDRLPQEITVLDLFKFPTVHALASHLARPVAVSFAGVRDRARRQQQMVFGRRPQPDPVGGSGRA